VIGPTRPYTTLGEFSPRRKQQTGKLTNAVRPEWATGRHLFMAELNSRAGIDKVNVVYRVGRGNAEVFGGPKPTRDHHRSPRARSVRKVRFCPTRRHFRCGTMPQIAEPPPAGNHDQRRRRRGMARLAGPAGMTMALVGAINGIFSRCCRCRRCGTDDHGMRRTPTSSAALGAAVRRPSSRASCSAGRSGGEGAGIKAGIANR